jgi:deoxyribodipyrimidine photolyase
MHGYMYDLKNPKSSTVAGIGLEPRLTGNDCVFVLCSHRRRMYWAKQIIGWTPDAQTALDYCLRLNNRWELDAVDPNSYAGVIWNFGRHDQGWKERPIWGKVRYMNEAGLKRKFNMAAYISKVDVLVHKIGLPDGIAQLRRSSKSRGKQQFAQTTLDETTSKRGKKRQNTS